MTSKPENHKRLWTVADIHNLVAFIERNTSVGIIAQEMGRTERAIQAKSFEMGLVCPQTNYESLKQENGKLRAVNQEMIENMDTLRDKYFHEIENGHALEERIDQLEVDYEEQDHIYSNIIDRFSNYIQALNFDIENVKTVFKIKKEN